MTEVYGQTATHVLDNDVGAVLFKFQVRYHGLSGQP